MASAKLSPERLAQAARELHDFTGAYLQGYRGLIAAAVEPLLRHYLTEYRPQRMRAERARDFQLASAAWQILGLPHDNATLKRAVAGVAQIRCEYDPTDCWPKGKDSSAAAVILRINEVLAAPKAAELTRVGRIFEILAEGYYAPDTRNSVRGPRKELFMAAKAIARLHPR